MNDRKIIQRGNDKRYCQTEKRGNGREETFLSYVIY